MEEEAEVEVEEEDKAEVEVEEDDEAEVWVMETRMMMSLDISADDDIDPDGNPSRKRDGVDGETTGRVPMLVNLLEHSS